MHPTDSAQTAICWAAKAQKLTIEHTRGLHNINVRRTIDLESGQTRMSEVITVDAASLNRVERLWGVMHRKLTHNRTYTKFAEFSDAKLGFLRKKVPRDWSRFRSLVADNFRVFNPKNSRVVKWSENIYLLFMFMGRF